ncbi:YceI family protein [Solihabitans fulvus]|uniref:YceI family protein n=1 Tax=Solihabitans fulvus TaxID=1892852 RepID=A0A5B2XHT5_9PSEU|nr:YceI family protein [Solihabitans fulvus]KAA2263397.1 YceI family protein [Solihabitans fulvus]
MATEARTYRIGPDNGRLVLHTRRAGLASVLGHDLTIEVDRWSGEITVAENPADSTLLVTVETGALRIIAATGGAKPLSERDKREILQQARKILDSDRTPTATYASTAVAADGASGGTVDGTFTLLGRGLGLRLKVTGSGDGRYLATGEVVQSDYGIKPYSAMFGALKLADSVGIQAEVDLSGDAG